MMRRAHVCWFTGLSGSGKSTIADGVRQRLEAQGLAVRVLDGDVVRTQLHPHLGFSAEDIQENNRRIALRCVEFRETADVILVPIISPYAASRAEARALLAPGFSEVYCDADLACVARRDVKGLYARAARGEIANMIGYTSESPYEPPDSPDCVLRTGTDTIFRSVETLEAFMRSARVVVRAGVV